MEVVNKVADVLARNSTIIAKVGNISKAFFLMGVGIWSVVDSTIDNGNMTTDSIWFYLLEIPFLLAATGLILKWPALKRKSTVLTRQMKLRLGVVTVDLIVAMVLAITSSFFFVDYVAEHNSVTALCQGANATQATLMVIPTGGSCETAQMQQTMRLTRTVFFMVFQILSVHSVVTFIIQNIPSPPSVNFDAKNQ